MGLLFSILGPPVMGLLANAKDLPTTAILAGIASLAVSLWQSFINLVALFASLANSVAAVFGTLLRQGPGSLTHLIRGYLDILTRGVGTWLSMPVPTANGANNAGDGSIALSTV
jgi:hypothetical protein